MHTRYDTEVLVIGAGPAGMALTTALRARGIDALCVAPSFEPWAPVYGCWVDEVDGRDVPFSHTWQRTRISFPSRDPVDLDRAYGRIDSAALHRRWSGRLRDDDASLSGVVSSVFFSSDRAEIRLQSGAHLLARQVFDATGSVPTRALNSPRGYAWQSAIGVESRRESETLSSDTMGLMLWDNGVVKRGSTQRIPAFYYVMPQSEGITFYEYTVLAARPLIPIESLEERLMKDLGSTEAHRVGVERCLIPMGHTLPSMSEPRVGFGSAAGMIHPATGYMIARVLRAAPQVADAYVHARDETLEERVSALWGAVWPQNERRCHQLRRLGLEALLSFNVAETHAFFAAFFALPEQLWRGYLGGADPGVVAEAMWAVFGRASAPIKAKLVGAGLRHPGELLRVIA